MAAAAVTYVKDLTPKTNLVNMKVRIIRRWGNTFKLEMILIDEKGGKIQATVKKDIIPRLGKYIQEDAVLLVQNFGVGEQKDAYPVLPLKIKMNFYKFTEVSQQHTWNGDLYGFNFVPFNEITKEKKSQVLNVDVIGSVTWCGNLEIFKQVIGKETKRINFDMKDLEGGVLRCTLWNDYAIQFSHFVKQNTSKEHVITIMQHAVIKEFNNKITVQSDMYGTRVFVNEDIKEANDMRRSLIVKEGGSTTSNSQLTSTTAYPTRDEFLKDTTCKHVDEIRECGKPMYCVVLGTIKLIEEEFGWFYLSCRDCTKKVYTKEEYLSKVEQPTEELINGSAETMWCFEGKKQAISIVPRFRVSLRVQDQTGTVSFLMWDRDVSKLVGLSATDIRERQIKSNDTTSFPHELQVLQNKTFAFTINIGPYNLDNPNSNYTIYKLSDDPYVISQLTSQDDVENEVSQEQPNAEVVNSSMAESSQMSTDSKDVISVTGDSSKMDIEKDTETNPLQKRKAKSLGTPGVTSTSKVAKKLCDNLKAGDGKKLDTTI